MEFDDGRLILGKWMDGSHLSIDKAGLKRVQIEDHHAQVLAECEAVDFVNIQSVAWASLRSDLIDSGKPLPYAIVGLKLISKAETTECLFYEDLPRVFMEDSIG